MSAPAPEVLSGAPDDAPASRWPRVVLALLLLVGAGAAVAQWEQQRQRAALLAAVEDAERVVGDSRTSLAGLVAYSSGALAQPGLGAPQRRALMSTFAQNAQRYVPRMQARRDAVADVRVLPWDDALRRARAAYLERMDGWTAFVTASLEDPPSLLLERRYTRADREQAVTALRTAAGRDADDVVVLLIR